MKLKIEKRLHHNVAYLCAYLHVHRWSANYIFKIDIIIIIRFLY